MSVSSLKLTSADHPVRFTVALGTSTCCQPKVLVFYLQKARLGLLQNTVNNEASARLAFYKRNK